MYVCLSVLIHMHIKTAELNRVTQGVGLRNPGWRRNWTCPLPRSGSVNLFKFLLFFLFSFLSLRGFSLTAWVTTSFGFWSLLNCHLPISNAFPTYQFAIKILHFYPIPTPFLRLFCSTCLVLPTPSAYYWRHGAAEQSGAAGCGCGGRLRGVSAAHTDHFHRWILQSQARQAAEESLCGSLQERK